MEIKPDIDYYQLYQSTCIHQNTETASISPGFTSETSGTCTARDFADTSDHEHHQTDEPQPGRIDQPDLRVQTTVDEIEREEKFGIDLVYIMYKFDGQNIAGEYHAHQKSAENGMDTNCVRAVCRKEQQDNTEDK